MRGIVVCAGKGRAEDNQQRKVTYIPLLDYECARMVWLDLAHPPFVSILANVRNSNLSYFDLSDRYLRLLMISYVQSHYAENSSHRIRERNKWSTKPLWRRLSNRHSSTHKAKISIRLCRNTVGKFLSPNPHKLASKS